MGFTVNPKSNSSSSSPNESDIPTAQGYWTPSPGGFVVEAKIGSNVCKDILIASSGSLSTMVKSEAERLGLQIKRASPLRVVSGPPGHTVSTISTSVATFVGNITDVQVPPVDIRLVDNLNINSQTVKVILGMDWLVETNVILLPDLNRIISRESIPQLEIPTAEGYWAPCPGGFVVEAKVGSNVCKDILIASSASLSTMDKAEAERLGLQIKRASPLRIVFGPPGDTVTKLSTSVATFVGNITDVQVPPIDIRLVENQSVKLILGMDWLVEADVILGGNPNRLYSRDSIRLASAAEAIPSVQGYWTSSPGGFVVEAKIGSKTCKDILIASSAGLSTMDKVEAERLGLEIRNVNPIRVVYGPPGHTISTISTSVAKFTGVINNVRVPPVDIRVVDNQNIKLILGMDWIEKAKIGLLFNPNRIYIQENEGLEELLRRTRP